MAFPCFSGFFGIVACTSSWLEYGALLKGKRPPGGLFPNKTQKTKRLRAQLKPGKCWLFGKPQEETLFVGDEKRHLFCES